MTHTEQCSSRACHVGTAAVGGSRGSYSARERTDSSVRVGRRREPREGRDREREKGEKPRDKDRDREKERSRHKDHKRRREDDHDRDGRKKERNK